MELETQLVDLYVCHVCSCVRLLFLHGILMCCAQDTWKTTLLLRAKSALKAKEVEEDDLT